MILNNFLFFILLGIFTSCASHSDKLFQENSDIDLSNSFGIDESKEISVKKIPKKEPSKDLNLIKPKRRTKIVVKHIKEGINVIEKIESFQEKEIAVTKEKKEEIPNPFKKYDDNSKLVWEKYQHRVFDKEEFVFEISFLGITAGFVKMSTERDAKLNNHDVFYFKAHLRSAQYYKYIYNLDDTLESYVDKETFLPLKYSLIQRESGQSVDDLQLFDHESHQTKMWYKRIKKDRNRNDHKVEKIPHFFQDSYSSLYFVRGLPLNLGDVYEFPVVTRAKIWVLKLKVEEIENIKVQGKTVSAIRVNAQTRFPGVLKKKGDIIFWYSNDDYRRLLRFQAKVKIGSINGELVEYKEGQRN